MAASDILFVTRYFWPELIGPAPFTSDIADWLAGHGHRTTVLSGLPHYPDVEVFPAYRNGRCRSESVGNVAVERLRSGPPRKSSAFARIANEMGFMCRGWVRWRPAAYRHPVVLALCPSIWAWRGRGGRRQWRLHRCGP